MYLDTDVVYKFALKIDVFFLLWSVITEKIYVSFD